MAERAPKNIDPLSPGARAIQGLRAGVVTRAVAGGIDYSLVAISTVLTYVAYAVLLFFVSDPRTYEIPTWPFLYFIVIGLFYLVVYLWISFATTGRTIGAGVMGVRVVGRKGRKMRWIPALVRAAFCAVFPIGLFWCAVSRENRSVQDIVLRTSVIHDWPIPRQEVDIDDIALKRIDLGEA